MVTARFLRTFAQSSIAVFFAIYLDSLGYSLPQIGLLVTAGSVGSTVFAFLIVFIGESLGRRRLLIGFSLMMGFAGLGFALTDHYLLLAIVSFFVGSVAVSGSGPRGPIQPLETASIPDTTSTEHHTDLFAPSGIVDRAARFLGTLAGALPALFAVMFDISELGGFKIMFVVHTAFMVASAAMYWLLSPAVDRTAGRTRWQNPFALPSRRTIFTLAAIFSVDSTATRFVFFSLVALWFKAKFGLDLAEVSYLLAGSTLMNMVSLWAAARIAKRIGLLNTVVYTHIPAVIFTVAVPFAPSLGLAVFFWFARAFFSQMDAPTRQAYTMAIVNREERVAMASITNVSQAASSAATPAISTILWQSVSASAPFLAAGFLKTVYLIGLYVMFKDVHPPEEEDRLAERRRPAESP